MLLPPVYIVVICVMTLRLPMQYPHIALLPLDTYVIWKIMHQEGRKPMRLWAREFLTRIGNITSLTLTLP